jgi:hypothetical protein
MWVVRRTRISGIASSNYPKEVFLDSQIKRMNPMSRYSRLIIVLSVSGLMMLALILLASIQTRLGGDTIHWA